MLANSSKREVLKGMVIPVFGFAELVQEKYNCLDAQNEDYSTNKASSIKGVLF